MPSGYPAENHCGQTSEHLKKHSRRMKIGMSIIQFMYNTIQGYWYLKIYS